MSIIHLLWNIGRKGQLISSASPFSLPTKSAHYLLFFKTYDVPFQGKWERSPQTSNSPYGQPLLYLKFSTCMTSRRTTRTSSPLIRRMHSVVRSVSSVWILKSSPEPPRPKPPLFHSATAWRPLTWLTKQAWLQAPFCSLPTSPSPVLQLRTSETQNKDTQDLLA